MKVVLRLSFLALSNVDIQLDTKSFTWRSYIIAEALIIATQVDLIN